MTRFKISFTKFFIVIPAILWACCFPVFAAEPTLTASASPSTVAVGEQLQVTFTVNGSGTGFHAPTFNDFNVVIGPSQSSSTQIFNGNISQSISYTYVLVALKEGTFRFGSASIEVGGKKIVSNTLAITVTKGNPASKQQASAQAGQHAADAALAGGKNVFLRSSVDKSNVYLGEGIVVTYKLYTKVNLASYSISKLPALNGFWSQDIASTQQPQFHSENYDGASYKVAEIKKMVIFPQRSGTLELDAMEGEVLAQVQVKRQRNPNDPFDQFFNDPFFNMNQWQNVKVPLKSELVKINVRALPPNEPPGFNGAVGKFNMEVSLDKKETKAHEPVTLKIKISGKGNLKLMDPPKVEFPSEFETYDPKITSNLTATTAGVSGSKTFEFLVIPRNAGEFKIPVQAFSFFDLERKQYETVPAKDLVVKVDKGDETITTAVTGVNKSDVQLLGKDIRFIKTNKPEFVKRGDSLFGSAEFYTMVSAPALLFVALLLFRRRNASRQGNAGLLRSQRANKIAKKRLASAKKYLAANEKEKFLDEMFKALWGFISDKLQIPVSELSKESASQALQNRNVKPELISKFVETIDTCEYARFAPGTAESNEEIYRKGIEVITQLEQ